jgi:hypothetical protein
LTVAVTDETWGTLAKIIKRHQHRRTGVRATQDPPAHDSIHPSRLTAVTNEWHLACAAHNPSQAPHPHQELIAR